MKIKDYQKLEQINISASIYEREKGKDYAGFVKFEDSPDDMFRYALIFSRNLKNVIQGIEKKPLTVLSMTEFELRDCKTNRKIQLEDYSAFELIGLTVGGAKTMLEGRYDEVNGVKMSFARTKVHKTKSIEALLNRMEKKK